MDKKNIKNILEELYLIDGDFRQHEKELKKIISELFELKPQNDIEEEFKQELKEKLLLRASELKEKNTSKLTHFNFKNLTFAFGSALILTIVAGSSYYFLSLDSLKKFDIGQSKKNKILADHAFGDLKININSVEKSENEEGNFKASDIAIEKMPLISSNITPPEGRGGGLKTEPDFIPPSNYQVNYTYSYRGESQPELMNKIEVLRRKSEINSDFLNKAIDGFDLGINFSSFESNRIQSFNLIQDKDFGYSIYVDLQNGLISISENWGKWPLSREENKTTKLSDEKIKEITEKFIEEYQIDMSNYGQPEISKDQMAFYERTKNENESYYSPEIINVIYPLKINEKEVYDTLGNKIGTTVSVKTDTQKVSGFFDYRLTDFESSGYEGETSWENILNIVKRGGVYGENNYFSGYIEQIPEAKREIRNIEISLEEPKTAYMIHNNFSFGKSEELFIPVLVFPSKERPEQALYYQKNIIVPLAKDIFPEKENSTPPQIIENANEIDPLIKPLR